METYKVIVDENKTIRHFNDKGLLHRLDGPAIEYTNGYKAWYVDGKCHRLDGPAIVYPDGSETWCAKGINMTKKQIQALRRQEDGIKYKLVKA
jgi:hypothetical protein